MKRLMWSMLFVVGCGAGARVPTGPAPRRDLASAKPSQQQQESSSTISHSGTQSNDVEDGPKTVTNLDTIRISVVGKAPSGEFELKNLATQDLFNQGIAAAKTDSTRALALFRQLAVEFPDSQFTPIALFNMAAIYDGRGDSESTLANLHELINKYPQSRQSVDGHLYLVALLAEKDRYAEALIAANELLGRANLSFADQIEAWARKGYLQIELGKLVEADQSLQQAIAAWKQIPKLEDSYFIAMAFYYRGDILYRQFAALPVRLPDAQLRTDLQSKEALAIQAYDRWKETLAFRQAYWATASGYRMSQIFVDFWRATVTAPYPRAMSMGARRDYVREIHERVRPQLEKALQGHQMNVELAAAYGVNTRWSDASKLRAAEILTTVAKESSGEFIGPNE
jgi:tetratricopeptide (TPR) repeat protein